jgi:hypothetical protein
MTQRRSADSGLRASDRILDQRHPEGLAKSNEGDAAEKFNNRCAVQATNSAELGNRQVGSYLGYSGRVANVVAAATRGPIQTRLKKDVIR